jgi:two-component system response regulator CpxR
MRTARVLLVDDDVEFCHTLVRLLGQDGFDVTAVHDGVSGVEQALHAEYSLVILDIMLLGGDGRMVLRRIRTCSHIPVIMLTARGNEADRIAGLEGGADDYLAKPFNVRELLARMGAVLRRQGQSGPPAFSKIDDLEIQHSTRTVLQNGEPVSLTGAEFDILTLLVRSSGKVLSREEIAELALGRRFGVLDRSIDNHVSNLRKKLGSHVAGADRIRNVRGAGYVYTGEVR